MSLLVIVVYPFSSWVIDKRSMIALKRVRILYNPEYTRCYQFVYRLVGKTFHWVKARKGFQLHEKQNPHLQLAHL